MLRTTIIDLPSEQRWILQGRLCRRWATDLKEKWASTRSMRGGRSCSIDLEDVTSVDEEGENVLLEMLTEGAVFVAHRAYTKNLVESLMARNDQ
jgi:ABC-type transporter Mla MlaB component